MENKMKRTLLFIISFVLIVGCSKPIEEQNQSVDNSKLIVMSKEVQEYLFITQDILKDYIVIHDKLFSSYNALDSLLKIYIPMDFKNYKEILYKLNYQLKYIRKQLLEMDKRNFKKEEKILNIYMDKYIELLVDTISQLGIICSKLEKHSTDFSYQWDSYATDLENYRKSTDEYMEYGKIVNKQLEKFLITD